jgi:hypothetical protein
MKALKIFIGITFVSGFFACSKCIECTYVDPGTGIRRTSEKFCGNKEERDAFTNNYIKEANFFDTEADCKEK